MAGAVSRATQQELAISRRSQGRAEAQRQVDADLAASREAFEERAAIREYDGNQPRPMAELRARAELGQSTWMSHGPKQENLFRGRR